MDEDDNDHEKTQIWLPGGELPKPKKPTAAAHEVLLKPARKPPAEQTKVDFDITTGSAASTTTAAPERKTEAGKAAPPVPGAQNQSALGWITVVVAVLVILVAGFLLTR
ncbi:MAG: hypothetical protein WD928_15815 [Gammaproteobacteria bacterium]